MAVRFGEKVGDAYFDVHARGDGFEREVRAIGQKAGTVGGKSFAKSFDNAVKKEEGTFTRAFRNVAGKIEGILRQGRPLRTFSDIWGDLGHNTKQWTLIIGAVLAGMQQIAVLGSAAGAGLLVLGGAATGAVVGIGSLVAAFAGLTGEIDDLPESIRPAAKAFQDLKTPLEELQDLLQERAFAGAERAFESIGQSIRTLTPAFGRMGDVINGLINDFADWLASSEGIRLMNGLIENSAGIFDKLLRTTGKLGRALLIAFENPRFQKAIDDMLTGLGGMFDQFADFVASDEFGVWIENTSGVLGELGELIGATSKMFADLITPEAYKRTEEFLQNLTDFMPHLGQLLDILGRLDIFGLLAQLLADLGDALEPLAGPMGDLAEALGELISIAIDEWAKDLKPIAEALAPFVQALADFIKSIPPEVVRAIASALLYLGLALLSWKAISWAAMVTGLTGFFGSLKNGKGVLKNFPASKLGSIAKGLGAIGLITATQLIPDDFWEQFDIESNLPNNVLTGAGFGLMFGGWGAVIGAGIGFVVSLFTEFESTMNDIGTGLLGLVSSGPLGLFGAQVANLFAQLVPEEWRGSDNPLQATLALLAFVITDTGTAIKLTVEEIGRWWDQLVLDTTQMVGDVTTRWNTLWATLNNPLFWGAIQSAINNWINAVAAYIKGKLAEIGANWAAFWAGLGTTAQGYWNYIINVLTAFLVRIKVTIQGGLSGAAAGWNNFWGGLPNAVSAAVGRITGLVNGLLNTISRALGGVGNLSRQANSIGGVLGGNGRSGGSFASGGILSGPRRILAGEQGPEAIVPLRRNLSQVDPSVRWLAALAQGRMPAMASGGVVGGGRSTIVEAGAIVVQEANSALATGVEVLDRLSARLV